MEDEQFQTRLQRLDRDIIYFQHILQEAPQRERSEIRRQLLAALREKKTLLQRQKELSRTQIEQKNLENERMARVLEVLERRRNEQNWAELKMHGVPCTKKVSLKKGKENSETKPELLYFKANDFENKRIQNSNVSLNFKY